MAHAAVSSEDSGAFYPLSTSIPAYSNSRASAWSAVQWQSPIEA